MATTRDFQEYASSGELTDIKIGGTSNSYKVATMGDIPTGYVTDAFLIDKFAAGGYTSIKVGGSGTQKELATKEYVATQITASGGYSNSDVKDYLGNLTSNNNMTIGYIGASTVDNTIVTKGYLDSIDVGYGDSDVQTLLSSGSVTSIYIGAEVVATRTYVDNKNAEQNDVDARYDSTTTPSLTSADNGKIVYLTNTSSKTITLDYTDFGIDKQVAVSNLSTSDVTIAPNSSELINGVNSSILAAIPPFAVVFIARYQKPDNTTGFVVG